MSLPRAGAVQAAITQKTCAKQKKNVVYLGRFVLCFHSAWSFREIVNGKVVGRMSGRLTITGKATSAGSRTVRFVLAVTKIKTSGTLGAATLTASMPCKGKGCSTPKARRAKGGDWKKHPIAKFTFTAPAPKKAPKIASAKFGIRLRLTHHSHSADAKAALSTYRCDGVSYLHNKSGCVFSRFPAEVGFSASSKTYPDVAAHIYQAQSQPASTQPTVDGKSVPGSLASKHPLHRTLSATKAAANAAAAVATCVNVWGENYTDGGKTCNEYPFKSTLEGAAKGNNQYSVIPLAGDQSDAATTALAAFYKGQRVLDGEAFYVVVVK